MFDQLFLPAPYKNQSMNGTIEKDLLIFLKLIPCLLWLFHQGKSSSSKYGIKCKLRNFDLSNAPIFLYYFFRILIIYLTGKPRLFVSVPFLSLVCNKFTDTCIHIGSNWGMRLIIVLNSFPVKDAAQRVERLVRWVFELGLALTAMKSLWPSG